MAKFHADCSPLADSRWLFRPAFHAAQRATAAARGRSVAAPSPFRVARLLPPPPRPVEPQLRHHRQYQGRAAPAVGDLHCHSVGAAQSWQRVENLLLALDARRARERDGLLEHAMRVVVYSSGCRVDDPARRAGAARIGESPSALMRAAAVLAREANVSETYARPLVGALAQDVANVNPLVDAHTAAIVEGGWLTMT
ncbi:unnamed protein product [Closterium sp. Naga37s-1]|nr:unnamed protein product [Closterium sp. Naga37s-1]